LPTEAQWEYAARGGERYTYAGSNDPDRVGWYSSNSQYSTHSVKTKTPNAYGLYDMSGNVWEWTLDEWHSDYDGAPTHAEEPWGSAPKCRQRCDKGSSGRVIRGGSWNDRAGDLRVADRDYRHPGNRYSVLGFRVRRTFP
jgi:formylglycine-generating enzyme required for sulfatase activity